jgi:hypothetical protein
MNLVHGVIFIAVFTAIVFLYSGLGFLDIIYFPGERNIFLGILCLFGAVVSIVAGIFLPTTLKPRGLKRE